MKLWHHNKVNVHVKKKKTLKNKNCKFCESTVNEKSNSVNENQI